MEERFPEFFSGLLSILVRGKEKEYGAQLKELGYEYDLCLESLGRQIFDRRAGQPRAQWGDCSTLGATIEKHGVRPPSSAAQMVGRSHLPPAAALDDPIIDPGASSSRRTLR